MTSPLSAFLAMFTRGQQPTDTDVDSDNPNHDGPGPTSTFDSWIDTEEWAPGDRHALLEGKWLAMHCRERSEAQRRLYEANEMSDCRPVIEADLFRGSDGRLRFRCRTCHHGETSAFATSAGIGDAHCGSKLDAHCNGMVHERNLLAQAREHMTDPNPEPELLELVPPPSTNDGEPEMELEPEPEQLVPKPTDDGVAPQPMELDPPAPPPVVPPVAPMVGLHRHYARVDPPAAVPSTPNVAAPDAPNVARNVAPAAPAPVHAVGTAVIYAGRDGVNRRAIVRSSCANADGRSYDIQLADADFMTAARASELSLPLPAVRAARELVDVNAREANLLTVEARLGGSGPFRYDPRHGQYICTRCQHPLKVSGEMNGFNYVNARRHLDGARCKAVASATAYSVRRFAQPVASLTPKPIDPRLGVCMGYHKPTMRLNDCEVDARPLHSTPHLASRSWHGIPGQQFTYVTAAGEVIVRQGTLKSADCSQVSIGVDGRPDGWRACPECRALPKTESVLDRLNSVINGGAEADSSAKDSTLSAGEMAARLRKERGAADQERLHRLAADRAHAVTKRSTEKLRAAVANDSLPDIIASLKAMASLDPATVGGAASSNACRIAGNILDSALRREKGPNATRGIEVAKDGQASRCRQAARCGPPPGQS